MPDAKPGEFDLIRQHFTRPTRHTLLGVGDDAALLQPSAGQVLAVSTDMLVAGRHFLPDTDPGRLGHKAMAVNLSDLAAMGARPRWATLAIALPEPDPAWLAAFADGFHAEAQQYGVDWVGGDTTAGPLNLSVTILGEVAAAAALRRSGARPGDQLWVSGTLGEAACGLACLQGQLDLPAPARTHCIARLEQPTPRVALGLQLAGLASAAIDISDGLLADLNHLAQASGVAAVVQHAALPTLAALAERRATPLVDDALLAGGDDYELCFTAPAAAAQAILAAGIAAAVTVTCIGTIRAGSGVTVVAADGTVRPARRRGFDHFDGATCP